MITTYIIITVILLLTLIILYSIIKTFDIETLEKPKEVSLDIKSDYIVILSLDGCPHCIHLNEKIKKSKSKYTVITLKDSATFNFDSAFLELSLEERNNIITELRKLFTEGILLFPCIIVKNKIYKGLQKEKILNNIFNL